MHLRVTQAKFKYCFHNYTSLGMRFKTVLCRNKFKGTLSLKQWKNKNQTPETPPYYSSILWSNCFLVCFYAGKLFTHIGPIFLWQNYSASIYLIHFKFGRVKDIFMVNVSIVLYFLLFVFFWRENDVIDLKWNFKIYIVRDCMSVAERWSWNKLKTEKSSWLFCCLYFLRENDVMDLKWNFKIYIVRDFMSIAERRSSNKLKTEKSSSISWFSREI